jgi:hypothetical protein
MLFKHRPDQTMFYTIVIGGAATLVLSLYNWLTTPLED